MDFGIRSIQGVNARYLQTARDNRGKAQEKLSSGLRIARASDDAAGLGASERMRSVIRSLDQASRNTLQGVDLAKTAESALGDASEILGRMRELAVQSSTGTLNDSDRALLDQEYGELSQQLDDLGANTEFNGQSLLDGSKASVGVQSGVNAGDTTEVELSEVSASALALDALSIDSSAGAASAIEALDSAIASVSDSRGELGASINMLDGQRAVLSQASLQLSSSESRLRDVDIAYETAIAVQQQMLAKGSSALLSQSFLFASAAGRLL